MKISEFNVQAVETDTQRFQVEEIRKLQDDYYLPARKVWERYGKTSMTLHRWLHDPGMNFPKPVYFGRFRYWKLSWLEEWEASCERQEVMKLLIENPRPAAGTGSTKC